MNLRMREEREEGESQRGEASVVFESPPLQLLLPLPLLLPLLLPLISFCLRHLSSLAETKTSASNGWTMLWKIDDSTLPLPLPLPLAWLELLLGVSHKLLVSPTKQSAILACDGAGGGAGAGAGGKNTLNLDVDATMPVGRISDSGSCEL
jgi:hypothetical protein